MGFLNDMKRLFWTQKAIAKSAAQKAAEAGKEVGEEMLDKSGELLVKAKDRAEDVGGVLRHKATEAFDKASGIAEEVGGKILETGTAAAGRAKAWTDDFLEEDQQVSTKKETNDIMDEILKETTEKSDFVASAEPTKKEKSEKKPEGYWEGIEEETAGLGKKVQEKGSALFNKLRETAGSVNKALDESPTVQKAKVVTEQVGDKVLDVGEEFMEKFGHTAEKVGGVVIEKGGDALEKAAGLASNLGAKILDAKDDLIAKSEADSANSDDTTDSIIDKMKEFNQQLEDKIAGKTDFDKEFAKAPPKLDSELDKHESFWEKAARYADGSSETTNKKTNTKPGEITIQQNPDYVKKVSDGTLKGFDDLDGDGDELIDDAIIEKD